MKKIFAFILCLCIALFSAGCTFVTTINLEMDSAQPWTIGISNFEECVYSVVKKDRNGVVLGKGELITAVTVGGIADKESTIECSFSFSEQAGIVDTITSSATIINDSCSTIRSSKEVVMNSNPDLSYSFVANYQDKTVSYYNPSSSTPVKTLEVTEQAVLDNEALYYLVRAFNPENKNEGNFLLTNLYDCYLSNKVSSYDVYYRASEDPVLLDKNSFHTEFQNDSWNVFSLNEQLSDNKIECHYIKINRSETGKTGAPVEMWLSNKAFKGGKTRVMVKMVTTKRSIQDSGIDYTIEYNLVSYRIG